VKGYKYTKKQIARALAAYDTSGDNISMAGRIVDIPKTTINNWLQDEELQKDPEIERYRAIEKDTLQQNSYNLANILIPRIMEKCMDDDARLRDIVGAYSQLVQQATNMTKKEAENNISIQMQQAIESSPNKEKIEEWLESDKDAKEFLKSGFRNGNGNRTEVESSS
jgi:transposase-like protein